MVARCWTMKGSNKWAPYQLTASLVSIWFWQLLRLQCSNNPSSDLAVFWIWSYIIWHHSLYSRYTSLTLAALPQRTDYPILGPLLRARVGAQSEARFWQMQPLPRIHVRRRIICILLASLPSLPVWAVIVTSHIWKLPACLLTFPSPLC